ncbi:MAG: hypothetical protein ACHQQR_06955 [Gemmatimonadales bacterium]
MMAIAPAEFGALLGTIFIGSSMLLLVKAWARKIENQSKLPKATPETGEHMERMERSIDAIALEVERISENQRFLTKLLAERGGTSSAALPRSTESKGGTT